MDELDGREISGDHRAGAPPRRTRPAESGRAPACARRRSCRLPPTAELGDGIHATIDEAVAAATRRIPARSGAQGLAGRKVIIDAVRRSMLDHAEQLARMAHQETHIGRARGQDRQEPPRRVEGARARGPRGPGRHRRRRDDGHRVRPVRRRRLDHAGHQPDLHDHQQHDQHRLGRQRGRLQRPSRARGAARRRRSASSAGRSSRPAARRTSSPAWRTPRSTPRARS